MWRNESFWTWLWAAYLLKTGLSGTSTTGSFSVRMEIYPQPWSFASPLFFTHTTQKKESWKIMERVRLTKLVLLTVLQGSLLYHRFFSPVESPPHSCNYCPTSFTQDLLGVNKSASLLLHVQVLEMSFLKRIRQSISIVERFKTPHQPLINH